MKVKDKKRVRGNLRVREMNLQIKEIYPGMCRVNQAETALITMSL